MNMKKVLGWFLGALMTLLIGALLWWSIVVFVCVVAVGVFGFIGFILFVDAIGEWLQRRR